jgi:hypothetical protein
MEKIETHIMNDKSSICLSFFLGREGRIHEGSEGKEDNEKEGEK